MNYRMILYVLGWIMNFQALFLLPSSVVGVTYREQAGFSIIITAILCLAIGLLIISRKPKKTQIYAREGFVIVAFSWIILSVFGALPFRISGTIPSMVDAVFEVASGFTTTGASILSNVEALPHCLLFWRSFTHWIGGMGVLVFVIAVLPLAGGSNMYLMKAESPGPSVKKLVPKVKRTAVTLYVMYLMITLIEIIFLLAGRMPLFDALTLSFGTAGTGGFGVRNDSIASYTAYQQIVITVFMILFGVNFNVYYLIYRRKLKEIKTCSEVFAYLSIIAVGVILISVNIRDRYPGVGSAIKNAAFQVGSIITTTGYSTVDFDQWPQYSRSLLVLIMFCGACAGSTGGGIKVSRILLMLKTVKQEVLHFIHPRSVSTVKLDGKAVDKETVRGVNVYLAAYCMIFVLSLLIITMFDNQDLVTVFTSVAATFNNIGPGLNAVGPMANYGHLLPVTKYVLMFDMLAGRLELFPMLLLFVPSVWKVKRR